MTKADSPDPVATAGILTYTITVNNAGPGTASNVVLSDQINPGATILSCVTSQGICSHPGVGTTGTVTADIGTLRRGGLRDGHHQRHGHGGGGDDSLEYGDRYVLDARLECGQQPRYRNDDGRALIRSFRTALRRPLRGAASFLPPFAV